MPEIDDISDASSNVKNLNPDELRLVIENWIQHQTREYVDSSNARFHVRHSQCGILQVVKL
ncbi:MAG: hypothetical protein E4G94_09080 [ANME-2 cluster archaeon]|nr:MAG: hypothetical protein E4G94_09080 [ANME-2 cluster archaeon]